MAQETKVGLLIGLALILLVGLVLSDLFTGPAPESAEASQVATEFGREAQAGIYEEPRPALNQAPSSQANFDRMPGFAAEPALDYRNPSANPPAERGLPSVVPSSPQDLVLPELTVEPPLPDLDTLEARQAASRFDESLEAMRLAVQNPVAITPNLDVVPTPRQDTPPAVAQAEEPTPAPVAGTAFIHYVQPGQTLTEIARQHYGNPAFAAVIAQTNPSKVDREGQVHAGARLEIPPLGSPVFSRMFEPVHADHAVRIDDVPALPGRPAGPTAAELPEASFDEILVQPGDTLSELAAEHLGSAGRWQELLEANSDRLDSAASLRSGMKLRLPSASPTAAVTPTPAVETTRPTAAASVNTYTVQAGDNLTRIAARLLGDGERWDDLLAANADQLDRPENLRVGMVLKLPDGKTTTPAAAAAASSRPAPTPANPALDATASPTKTYTVKAGDNLTRIAAAKLGDGDRWRELFEANADQLSSPDDLFAGQTLRLP